MTYNKTLHLSRQSAIILLDEIPIEELKEEV